MGDRYDGEPLPPVHPIQDGRPPVPDGDTVQKPPPPLPPSELRRAWLITALVVVIVLTAVTIGALR